jgi:aryl-alcohol dehydrogenase-like predicted oxidoreductase
VPGERESRYDCLRAPGHEEVSDGSTAAPFTALAELRQEGLIKHLGLSGVSDAQLTEAQAIAPVAPVVTVVTVVTVQNLYNHGADPRHILGSPPPRGARG